MFSLEIGDRHNSVPWSREVDNTWMRLSIGSRALMELNFVCTLESSGKLFKKK